MSAPAVFASMIAGEVLEKLGSTAFNESCLTWAFQDEIQKLKDVLMDIQAVLEDAEEQQTHNQEITFWLQEFKDACYEVDDLLDEFDDETLRLKQVLKHGSTRRKVRDFFSTSNPLVFRLRIGPKIEKAKKMLNEIAINKSRFHLIDKHQVKDEDASCSRSSSSSFSPCIFRTPFPRLQFQDPKLASIGPYHKSKNLPLEKYKYGFLDRFISRTKKQGKDLCFYVQQMMTLECRTRKCYSEDLSMSSPELVEMMLLDGCFIMETLVYFGKSGGSKDWIFPIEPWQLPILVRDLLILENQIPFFVLEMLFKSLESQSQEETPTLSLPTMALKFFDLAFPRSIDISCEFNHLEPHHLLDLFLHSILPSSPIHSHMKAMVIPEFVYTFLTKIDARNQSSISIRDHCEQQYDPPPPFYLTKNVMELQASGIELRSRLAARFTDIDFRNGVLEIPFVTIDDLFIAILVNCVAFEHCSKRGSKDLSAYVFFMSNLIRHPTDAELLSSNGIISRFSHINDQKDLESFHLLRINILDLDFQHSYLSERLKDLEGYYTRYGRTRCWLRHVSSYWRIFFFCITNLLFGFNRLRSVANSMIYIAQEVKFNGMYADFQLGAILCPQDHSSFIICKAVFGIAQFMHNSARGRLNSVDLRLSKFMDFFFLNVIIVIIMLMVCRTPAPTLTVDEQGIEDSVSVDEKHVEAEDQHVEVEDSITVVEMIVDCVSKDMDSNDEYYDAPWDRLLEYKVVRMLVSASRII